MKKVGIDAAQCAPGFRISPVILNLGVNEDSFECFIREVYNHCKGIGLSPENISFYLQDLLEFSRTALSVSEIPEYIKEKTYEKRKLEQQLKKLRMQIETLNLQKSDAESHRDIALQEERMTISELTWYSGLKAELRKYGIPIGDISKFGKIVDNIGKHGYDPGKVIKEFSDLELLKIYSYLQQTSQAMEKNIGNLEQQISTLEPIVKVHSQALSTYNHLEAMGFGLKEFDFLWNAVIEIAFENDLPVGEAVMMLVEGQYDKKLGFQPKIL